MAAAIHHTSLPTSTAAQAGPCLPRRALLRRRGHTTRLDAAGATRAPGDPGPGQCFLRGCTTAPHACFPQHARAQQVGLAPERRGGALGQTLRFRSVLLPSACMGTAGSRQAGASARATAARSARRPDRGVGAAAHKAHAIFLRTTTCKPCAWRCPIDAVPMRTRTHAWRWPPACQTTRARAEVAPAAQTHTAGR